MSQKLSGVIHARPINVYTGEYHNKGGMSIAYSVHQNGDVKVGLALCSFADSFNRRLGRNIAINRLNSEKEQDLAATLEVGLLELIHQNFTGEDKKVVVSKAETGEYFVRREDFPLTTNLLRAMMAHIVGIQTRVLDQDGFPYDIEKVIDSLKIVLYNGKIGFHFSEREFGEVLVS